MPLEEVLVILLLDMRVADGLVEQDERVAVIYAVGRILEFVRLLTSQAGVDPHGDVLESLLSVISKLAEGIDNPTLAPAEEPRRASIPDKTGAKRGKRPKGWPMQTQMLRAEAAASLGAVVEG